MADGSTEVGAEARLSLSQVSVLAPFFAELGRASLTRDEGAVG